MAQIVLTMLSSALLTYAIIVLNLPPSSWHALWMIILPALVGLTFNQGARQLVMAFALPLASIVAAAVVGNAIGGI
ncbi:hypothetical protein ASE90_15940 [Sphingomonas sp. Leaf67]|uniref:hypothetical protein n=2 Tax=unclassified Sphingomonas TaxID=196159 RepID=UPI0007001370|nr:hypothetical protein [Sphingomonas sp. Leaf67]KQN71197.1 hypothetical protein ASE91_08690 [Sphingomonas sp. Leaf62]KQN79825.1 hypothetical protein ASE90_15940 [Sphingomonas sp. Leaf67]